VAFDGEQDAAGGLVLDDHSASRAKKVPLRTVILEDLPVQDPAGVATDRGVNLMSSHPPPAPG